MATEILRPVSDGDEISVAYPSGVSHYDRVDEATPDEDTTRLWENSLSTFNRDLYNVDAPSGAGAINKITVYARCRGYWSLYTQTSLKCCIKSGTGSGAPDTVTDGSGQTIAQAYADYSEEWTTNPATGSAWTWDEIANLQIGPALRSHYAVVSKTVYCTQVYVEVDYTSVTQKTSSDSAAGADARLSGSPLALMSKADSGSGAEVISASAAILTGAEAGSGIELLFSLQGKLVNDSGTAVEISYISIIANAKSSADAGSGAEISGLLAALKQDETGSGDEILLSRALSLADNGAGGDAAPGLSAALTRAESGAGADSLAARLLAAMDNGAGLEALLSREVIIFDAGSGSEIATTIKDLLATDSGTGLEALAGLLTLITAREAARGSERLGARIMTLTGTKDIKLLNKKGKVRMPSRKVDL